ncbi:MAG: hypothetical protein SGPRY_007339, partial [Prymnesium sp.]
LNFGDHFGGDSLDLVVDVADPDVTAAEELDCCQRAQQVWDGIERRTIPAFPAARPNASHLKTPDEVEWHPDRRLGLYEVPEQLQNDIDKMERTVFNPWQKPENYVKRMHTLLFVEEAQQRKNFRKFDVGYAKLHESREGGEVWHKLMIEGLAERRPSVLKGDSVYVWVPESTDVEYEGVVESVLRDAAWLRLNPGFPDNTRGVSEFHVRFTFSRLQFRRMHAAIDNVDLKLVWPDPSTHPSPPPPPPTSTSVLETIGGLTPNAEQHECIDRISALSKLQSPYPLLVRGAFGTGKTSTVANAILKLLKPPATADSRILLCTECNAAADLYVTLLADHLQPKEMLRYYQSHRRTQMHGPLWKHSEALYVAENEIFRTPTVEEVMGYRLVVCTFDLSGVLWGIGCVRGCFSHIILDEAANALEPRSLIPLQLASRNTAIVMAGDDKQIAPTVQSGSARHHGLRESLLVRLARDPRCTHVVELNVNYRSDPQLLQLPSEIFYDGKLKAAPEAKVSGGAVGCSKGRRPTSAFVDAARWRVERWSRNYC